MKEKKLADIPLSEIMPNRFQPRIHFDEEKIESLAKSIIKYGVLEPIIVRPLNGKFEIIAGERRFKASKLAGKPTIPAIIVEYNDKESIELALLENIQRQELTAIEEAIAYRRILDMGYITQEELAKKTGKSQPTIANKMRLLSLDDETQEALINHKISERHARSLLKLTGTGKELDMLNKIINDRLTVRQTDDAIAEVLGNKEKVVPPKSIAKKEEPIKDLTSKKVNIDFHQIENLFDNQAKKEEKGENRNMDIEKILQEAEDINAKQQPKDVSGFVNVPSPYETIMDSAPAPANDISDIMNAPAQEEHNKFINVIPKEEPVEEKKEEYKPTVTFDSVFHSAFDTPAPAQVMETPVSPLPTAEPVVPEMPQPEVMQDSETTSTIIPEINAVPETSVLVTPLNSGESLQSGGPSVSSYSDISVTEETTNPLNFSSPLDQIKEEATFVPPVTETPLVNNNFTTNMEPIPSVEPISPATEIKQPVPEVPEITSLEAPTSIETTPVLETDIPSIDVTTPESSSVSDIPEFTSTIAESAPTSTNIVETPVSPITAAESVVPEISQPESIQTSEPINQNIPEVNVPVTPIMDGIQRPIETNMEPIQSAPINNINVAPIEPVTNTVDPVTPETNKFDEALNIIVNCLKQLDEAGYAVGVNKLDLGSAYQIIFNINQK